MVSEHRGPKRHHQPPSTEHSNRQTMCVSASLGECELRERERESESLWCEVSLLGRGEVKGDEVNNEDEKSEDSLGDAMSGTDSIVAWNTSKSKRLME